MALSDLFTDIANAIREKDGTTEPIVANNFPARIQAIPTGSKPGTPLDPVQVYKDTRPADWLPMPTPNDDEMYLLFHIPAGTSSLLAFTVTCASIYSVSLGTVENGQFVKYEASYVNSGIKYEAELFADDYGDLTADGFKQVMVKVSGTNIQYWRKVSHSKKSGFSCWNIVEISCKLPHCKKVECGSSTSRDFLYNLRYFSWQGENAMSNASYMFSSCNSLIAVLSLDVSKVTNMQALFRNCFNLAAVPALNCSNAVDMSEMFSYCRTLNPIQELDSSKSTNMNWMFRGCSSLTEVPLLDTANVTTMSYMFGNCTALRTIPLLDTANVTNMQNMFNYCSSLLSVPSLDTTNVVTMDGMFTNDLMLNSFELNPNIIGWMGADISLADCDLGHQALVDLFNSLPIITSSKSLTITGNPGVSELTDDEKAIATGKNWVLTL